MPAAIRAVLAGASIIVDFSTVAADHPPVVRRATAGPAGLGQSACRLRIRFRADRFVLVGEVVLILRRQTTALDLVQLAAVDLLVLGVSFLNPYGYRIPWFCWVTLSLGGGVDFCSAAGAFW